MPLPTQTSATIIILIKVQQLEKNLHFCNGIVGDCSQIVAHVNWFSLFLMHLHHNLFKIRTE